MSQAKSLPPEKQLSQNHFKTLLSSEDAESWDATFRAGSESVGKRHLLRTL